MNIPNIIEFVQLSYGLDMSAKELFELTSIEENVIMYLEKQLNKSSKEKNKE